MAQRKPIIVMAGGTGGHVFPALAVANYLRDQGENIVWMGTRSGIESRLVPEAGLSIEWLKVQGLRGKGYVAIALAPIKLVQACWQALQILRRHKPGAVLGMGGFVAGPGGLMARVLRIPLIIHEQNAVIGLTNKLLSRVANLCFFAFPQAASGIKNSRVVGNPLRKEIISIQEPSRRLSNREHQPLRLLVIGGSLGARTLNQVVPQAMATMNSEDRPEIRHQCGPTHLDSCTQIYNKLEVEAQVSAFIDDMKAAYEWADLVICRAGALTVSELAAAGIASILVPYPYAVDDHQFVNAELLQQAGAALRYREQKFTSSELAQVITQFTKNRNQLIDMACKARSVAYTDATEQVAQGVLQEARS